MKNNEKICFYIDYLRALSIMKDDETTKFKSYNSKNMVGVSVFREEHYASLCGRHQPRPLFTKVGDSK